LTVVSDTVNRTFELYSVQQERKQMARFVTIPVISGNTSQVTINVDMIVSLAEVVAPSTTLKVEAVPEKRLINTEITVANSASPIYTFQGRSKDLFKLIRGRK
jgi:hypothetical protein